MLVFNTIVYDLLQIVRNFYTIVYIFADYVRFNRTIVKSLSSVIVAGITVAGIVARITSLIVVVLRVVTGIGTH